MLKKIRNALVACAVALAPAHNAAANYEEICLEFKSWAMWHRSGCAR